MQIIFEPLNKIRLTLKEYDKNPFGINDHDAVLLKLHRIYEKDESIKFLFQTIDVLKIRIIDLDELLCKIRSENNEVIKENKSLNQSFQNDIIRKRRIRDKRKEDLKEYGMDGYVIELKAEIEKLKHQRKEFERKTEEWQNRYFSLLAKQNKNQTP